MRTLLNALFFTLIAAGMAAGGYASDFSDGGAQSWTGGGCPEVAAPAYIPAGVRVVPAHYVADQVVVTLDEAVALNSDASEANDVCVLEHLR